MIHFNQQFRYREDIGLLFDFRRGVFHKLENEVAIAIVKALLEKEDDRQAATYVSEEFDVAPDECLRDIQEFKAGLLDYNTFEKDRRWYSIDKGFSDPLKFPIRLEIELTSICNWNCGFCYNVWKIDPLLSDDEVRAKIRGLKMKHLPKEICFKVLSECAQKGCFVLRYSGGEPTIHPDLLEIVDYGGRLGIYQVLFTNGHFLNKEYVDALKRANVNTVLVSLHGDAETHNKLTGHSSAYEKALNGISLCLEEGIETVVEATLVKDNKNLLLNTIKDVYSRGAREFRIMRYVGTGKNDDQYAISPDEAWPLMLAVQTLKDTECPGVNVGWPCAQKFCMSTSDIAITDTSDVAFQIKLDQLTGHCESGLVWGSITYDGHIRNCPHSNVYHGNINMESLETGWGRMTRRVTEVLQPRDACSHCNALTICKGGCHLPHFLTTPGVQC